MPEFNFKSPVVTRKVRETEIILEEVIPSPFFVEKELKDINIVEAEASRIKIIQSFYERRGYAQISTDLLNYITNNAKKVYLDIYKEIGIMLDADGRVILDKSINYGKQ